MFLVFIIVAKNYYFTTHISGFIVKYLVFRSMWNNLLDANCEIESLNSLWNKINPHAAGVFHIAQQYFTHKVHFTNPKDLFRWKKSIAFAMLFFLEVPPGFEPGIRVLQTRALPLGYGTENIKLWFWQCKLIIYLPNIRYYNIFTCKCQPLIAIFLLFLFFLILIYFLYPCCGTLGKRELNTHCPTPDVFSQSFSLSVKTCDSLPH